MRIRTGLLSAVCVFSLRAFAAMTASAWIGDGRPVSEEAALYDEDPAPEFKAEFVLPEGVTSTEMSFACAGYASVRLNDRTLPGFTGLEPLWSVFDKTVYSRTVRIGAGECLRPYPATNTLYVSLGNGFYNLPPLRFWGRVCFRSALAHGRPCFKLALEGVPSPLEWKWRTTGLVRNSVYLGAEMDMTRPEDTCWKRAVAVSGPAGKITKWPSSRPQTRQVGYNRGKVRWLKKGEVQVVDFGFNTSGVPSFRFAGEKRGRRIEIVYGERLKPDGSVNVLTQTAGQIKSPGMGGPGAPDLACQKDVYICGGAPEERFEPPFTWHICRYAEIRGAENLLGPDDAGFKPVSMLSLDEVPPSGVKPRIENADLAAIHELCRRTFQANLIGGVQSDCPGRERLGYGGDIVATYEAYMLNFDMREIYLKVLRDFADEAEDDGWITETAPHVGIADRGFGGRAGPVSWALAVPELMDGLLRHYGEKRALDFYPVCARYIRLVDAECPDGIVPRCIGDHEALERAPDEVTATAHWHRFVSLTAAFARRLGKEEDAREFDRIARKVRAAFVGRYVKEDGTVANGTQSAQAIAFYLGLVPDDRRDLAFEKLVKAVEAKDCAPHTGIFSTRYMLMALSENGRADLARRIVLHRGFPGWLHMLDRGATTLWETWKESDNVFSNCHPMFGSVDEWIIKYAAAVKTTVNIVNFVRGAEPRNPSLDLVEPVLREAELNTKYGFPNTFLLQYDAMLRDDIMAAALTSRKDLTEYGLWLEVVRQQCEQVGIKWRGRVGFSWDWYVNPGMTVSYTRPEREKLVDEAFRLFKEKFGCYPESVGSWMIDAYSMDYMQRKYGVKGFCICREQDNVDAYTLRGGYFSGAYYPSKKNMLSAAVDMENAVRAPVFRMLTPDPIYNYDKSVKPINGTVCPTLEPVWQSNPRTIDWFFRVYTGPGLVNFSYMQIGQENSFGWNRFGKGLRLQLEKLAAERAAGNVVVEKMRDTAERFARTFPENRPQTQVALEDWCGQAKSVWYNSKHYRANLLWEKGSLRFRDLHKMCDGYEEPYIDSACKSWKADCFTPAVLSEYFGRWDQYVAPVKFKGEFTSLSVDTSVPDTLKVSAARKDGGTVEIVFTEAGIAVKGDGLDGFRGGAYRFFGCDFEVPVSRNGDSVTVDMGR